MRQLVAVAILAGALGLCAPPASAGMTWDLASAIAVDYWQARDVTVPCEPQPVLLTEAEDVELRDAYGFEVDMVADLRGCRVLIAPYAEWMRTDHQLSWMYCAEVAHEFGHHGGLDHGYGAAMDGAVPFGCAHPRQWMVKQGWRRSPRWVRRGPARVERLWLAGRVWKAQVTRARWLRSR